VHFLQFDRKSPLHQLSLRYTEGNPNQKFYTRQTIGEQFRVASLSYEIKYRLPGTVVRMLVYRIVAGRIET
jgi:hypothetical protein